MHTLTIKNKVFFLPSNVNELTAGQHRWLNEHQIKGQKLTPWNVFFRMLNHPKNAYLNRLWLCGWLLYNIYLIPLMDRLTKGLLTLDQELIDLNDWYDLVHWCTEFMTTDQSPFYNPPYRWLWGWFTSPGDGFKYLSFGEFLEADQALAEYQDSQAERDLNTLIAYLYLPFFARAWPWYRRFLGQEESVNRRARLLGKLPLASRLTIVHYFSGSRQAMTLHHPHVFPQPDPESVSSKKTNIRNDYRDWFNHISGSPLNNAHAYVLPVWEVVSSMESKIIEAKRMEAEYKKANP